MNIRKLFTTTSLAALASVAIAAGASAATFTIDAGDVTVSGVDFCAPGDCKLEGAVTGGSFDLSNVGDSATLDSLFDWDILLTNPWASGVGGYSVNVTLNFSEPSPASANGSGYAGFVTLLGTVSAGALHWTNGVGNVAFADGYALGYKLHDALEFGLGLSTETGATFTLTDMPAPVPLPASALLLMAGVGAFAAYRRRKTA